MSDLAWSDQSDMFKMRQSRLLKLIKRLRAHVRVRTSVKTEITKVKLKFC